MTISRKKIEKSLAKKGFVLNESKDHRYFHLFYKGIDTGVFTYVSHSGKDIDDYLISKMQKQLRLDNKRLACDLFNCPMSKDDYLDILIQKKIIDE